MHFPNVLRMQIFIVISTVAIIMVIQNEESMNNMFILTVFYFGVTAILMTSFLIDTKPVLKED